MLNTFERIGATRGRNGGNGTGRAALGWLAVLAVAAGLSLTPWAVEPAHAGGRDGHGALRSGHDDRGHLPRHHRHQQAERVTVPAADVDVAFRDRDDDRRGHDRRHHAGAGLYRVHAANVGGVAYAGPVLLVFDRVDRRTFVADACGHLRDGRPYLCLQRSGAWAPGDTTPDAYVRILSRGEPRLDWHVEAVAVEAQDNTAPVADAGADATARVGATVTLDGSASSDADGDSLTFAWTLAAVPAGSAAVLSDPSAIAPTFRVDRPGTYEAGLVVNDGLADSAPDTVVVTTGNSPPVANAGADRTVGVGSEVALDGAASFDPDGDAISFLWALTGVPEGSAAALSDPTAEAPSFVADLRGTYTASLVVDDGWAESAADTVVIDTAGSRPVADAGPDRAARAGDPVTLDGTASFDADGDALTFAWAVTVRPAGSAADLDDPTLPTPAFTPDVAGDYLVQLIVGDGLLDSVPDTALVTAGPPDAPPVADAGADVSVPALFPVAADGAASFDPEGGPLTFGWTIRSAPAGSTATLAGAATATPSLVPDRVGAYVLRLVVNDGHADSAPAVMTVTATNLPPVAAAGADRAVDFGSRVALDGSGSSDPDGQALSYAWSFQALPAGSVAVLDLPTAPAPSFAPDLSGLYVLALVVGDGLVTTTDTVSVTVRPQPPVTLSGMPTTVGAGLMNFCCTAVLGTANHGGVTLRIASGDPGMALVAANSTTAGAAFIDVPMAHGTTNVGFWVQGVAGATGVVTFTASAPGFATGTGTVTVVRAGFRINGLAASTTAAAADDPFQVQVGVPNAAGTNLAQVQPVRFGAGPLQVTVTNADAAVGRLVTSTAQGQSLTVPIQPGSTVTSNTVSLGGVAFDALAVGTTQVEAAAPGLLTTTAGRVTVTVAP